MTEPAGIGLPPTPGFAAAGWDLLIVAGLLVVAGVITIASFWFARSVLRGARERAESMVDLARREAEMEARRIRSEALLEVEKSRAETARQIEDRRAELAIAERSAAAQRDQIARTEEEIRLRESRLQAEEEALSESRATAREQARRLRGQLEGLAGLTPEQARARLIEEVRADADSDLRLLRRDMLDLGRRSIEVEARQLLVTAMQRLATQTNHDLTATLVSLPSEEMKGRIIGREGRNIKSFEAATGVTLLIDDSPQTVLISCFDPVRREVARLALDRLIQDGRIHPAAIEEVVARAQREVDSSSADAGEAAAAQLKLAGLPRDLAFHLGRLRFRYSYSQNVLDHSLEVALLAGQIAAELRLDPGPARRAGLLHDIGKSLDAEIEGSHAVAGAELARRQGEAPLIVNAIAAHHEEVPAESIYAGLVILADRISAVRPGARAESVAGYVERLDRLEKLALAFPGVQSAFAVSAGREIRVVVAPDAVTDEAARELAVLLRRRIEEEVQYPGVIRITVIREQRFVETAR